MTNDVPIPYQVNVLANGGTTDLGNASDLIEAGLQDWLPTIKASDVLSLTDRESESLRHKLFLSAT